MLTNYLTVNPEGSAEIEIDKSRFIGHVKRCETEEEAKAFILSIKKTHSQANHNCAAYLIGENDQYQKALDDGEPRGTAGVPMLEVLKKKELKDTCVVVTRYFGGVKLGAGGLIRAYTKATTEALNQTGMVNRKYLLEQIVSISYPLLGKIENELEKTDYRLHHVDYAEHVTLSIYIETEQADDFMKWIVNLTSDTAEIIPGDGRFIDLPIKT